jgi:hypothetical protein
LARRQVHNAGGDGVALGSNACRRVFSATDTFRAVFSEFMSRIDPSIGRSGAQGRSYWPGVQKIPLSMSWITPAERISIVELDRDRASASRGVAVDSRIFLPEPAQKDVNAAATTPRAALNRRLCGSPRACSMLYRYVRASDSCLPSVAVARAGADS